MSIAEWLGQSTTGAGFATLFGTLGAMGAGSMNWQHAVPLMVGAVIGLIWPESIALRAAAEGATGSIEALLMAYQTGLQHAQDGATEKVSVPTEPVA